MKALFLVFMTLLSSTPFVYGVGKMEFVNNSGKDGKVFIHYSLPCTEEVFRLRPNEVKKVERPWFKVASWCRIKNITIPDFGAIEGGKLPSGPIKISLHPDHYFDVSRTK